MERDLIRCSVVEKRTRVKPGWSMESSTRKQDYKLFCTSLLLFAHFVYIVCSYRLKQTVTRQINSVSFHDNVVQKLREAWDNTCLCFTFGSITPTPYITWSRPFLTCVSAHSVTNIFVPLFQFVQGGQYSFLLSKAKRVPPACSTFSQLTANAEGFHSCNPSCHWIPVYPQATDQALTNGSVFRRPESEAETHEELSKSPLDLTVSQLTCSDFSPVPFHSSAELQNIIDAALFRLTVVITDWSAQKINLFLMFFLFQNSMDSIFVKEGMQKAKSGSGL